jgi:crossover junction endodeoxyribonuclease RuvC
LKNARIILGIDPGTLFMGYGLIAVQGGHFTVREMDVLKLSSKEDHYLRLQQIHQCVCGLIEQYGATEFAIEAPFFGKNVQSMLKLGRAQGVAIAAAMQKSLPVTEYSPRKVKQAITGNGNAGKEQVYQMLQRLTVLPDKPLSFDATDALAVAVCHSFGSHLPVHTPAKKAKVRKMGWDAFIRENPERVNQNEKGNGDFWVLK